MDLNVISVYIKFIWMIVFTFLIFFIARSVHSETMGDLIWEKEYIIKNTNIPFSGEINETLKADQNGKKEGTWVRYYSNGQLFSVSNYETGKKNGAWITYNNKGHLIEKGHYKNDLEEGHWIRLFENGKISYKGKFNMAKNQDLGLFSIIMDNWIIKGIIKTGPRMDIGNIFLHLVIYMKIIQVISKQ